MRPMSGRFRLCDRQGVAEREGSNLPMVGVGSPEVSARGGMGGTRRHSIIEATPDFCIETARCLNHNILWYAARDRGISRGFSLEEL